MIVLKCRKCSFREVGNDYIEISNHVRKFGVSNSINTIYSCYHEYYEDTIDALKEIMNDTNT